MSRNDLGYYMWQILKAEEETTLFPELYAIFKEHSRYDTFRSLLIHPQVVNSVDAVAPAYGLDPDVLREAFGDVLEGVIMSESDDRFKLFWDFIYYFGGTKLEVPAKDQFRGCHIRNWPI